MGRRRNNPSKSQRKQNRINKQKLQQQKGNEIAEALKNIVGLDPSDRAIALLTANAVEKLAQNRSTNPAPSAGLPAPGQTRPSVGPAHLTGPSDNDTKPSALTSEIRRSSSARTTEAAPAQQPAQSRSKTPTAKVDSLDGIKGTIPTAPTPGYELNARILQELALLEQFVEKGVALTDEAAELYHLIHPLASRRDITSRQTRANLPNSALPGVEGRFIERARFWLSLKFPEFGQEDTTAPKPVQQARDEAAESSTLFPGYPVHQESDSPDLPKAVEPVPRSRRASVTSRRTTPRTDFTAPGREMTDPPEWVSSLIKAMAEEAQETRKLTRQLVEARNPWDETMGTQRTTREPQTFEHTERELNPAIIGLFEPKSIPDSKAAYLFIESIRDSVAQFGEGRTRGSLRQCLGNGVAREWYLSLGDEERLELSGSTASWCRDLRRDFLPRAALLEMEASRERFRWNQARQPSEYAAKKVRMLRMAGIKNDKRVIEEIHAGFTYAPEIHGLLETVIDTCNTVSDYRAAITRFQGIANGLWNSSGQQKGKTASGRIGWTGDGSRSLKAGDPVPTAPPTSARQLPRPEGRPPPPKKTFNRNRKCRNFPRCGDGEHWDDQCPLRGSPRNERRAYYAGDLEEDSEEVSKAEKEYALAQDAFYTARGRELDPLTSLPPTLEETSPATDEAFVGQVVKSSGEPESGSQCDRCRRTFASGNQLHKHLKTHENAAEMEPPPLVVISTAPITGNIEKGLSDCHFAEISVYYDETLSEEIHICADSGFGNSGIDRTFLERIVARGAKVQISQLEKPRIVKGIGGGTETAKDVALVPVYMRSGNVLVRIVAACFVFASLGCRLLLGNDTLVREKATIVFGTKDPYIRFGACEERKVPIRVNRHKEVARVTVRAKEKVQIPAHSARVVEIRTTTPLEPGQDYLFEPRAHPTLSTTASPVGRGLSRGIFQHDQSKVLFTNFADTEITVFKGTTIGYVSSLRPATPHVLWMEAAEELSAFWGLEGMLAEEGEDAPTAEKPRSRGPSRDWGAPPTVTSEQGVSSREHPKPGGPKSKPTTEEDLPSWLDVEYRPQQPYPLPEGITVPTAETSTFSEVIINKDLPEVEQDGLRRLVKRHSGLFNDGKGCAREPEADWLRIPVSTEKELGVKPRPPYRLSPKNENVVNEQFDDHVRSGRLSPCASSPFGLQVFVVWRDGRPRPVVDMRPLNALVPADTYPLPRQERIIDAIKGKRFLSTCDITAAFYQRLIHPADRHRAGVISHRGHEMFNVAIMGYKTSPQHQQRFMDKNFEHLAWRTMACFVDDLVTFSDSYGQHLLDLDEVFCILEDLGLTLKAKKSFLGFQSLELLGYLVDRLGLTTTESKSRAITELEIPETLAQLEYFIGLTNWNRHLIPLYGQKCEPLQAAKTKLLALGPNAGQARRSYASKTKIAEHVDTKPGSPFYMSFRGLKEELASKPALYHFHNDRELYVFVDASKEMGIGAAAYQMANPGAEYSKAGLRPILFLSRVLTGPETRYWPTELEFSGLVWAVKMLTTYIEQTHTTFVTDHKPSVDIINMSGMATASTARANFRLQAWAIFLSQYAGRITVTYTRGKEMEVPDALLRMRSRVSELRALALTRAEDHQTKSPMEGLEIDPALTAEYALLGEKAQAEKGIVAVVAGPSEDFVTRVVAGYEGNRRILSHVRSIEETDNEVEPGILGDGAFVLVDAPGKANTEGTRDRKRVLFFIDPASQAKRLVIPNMELRREILRMAHDEAAHQGLLRTYQAAAKGFYWRGMVASIKDYIAHCRRCQQNKTWTHRPYAQLRPIFSPGEPFHTMAVDLITDLPEDSGMNTIMTVTDKFTKAVRFLSGRKDDSSVDWARSFQDRVVNGGWGYPRVLVSDRDPRFLSAFWKNILRMAGAKSITTTAHHPAGDGQSERTNQTLEIALRYYVDKSQNGWVRQLPFLEATLNNMESSTTGRAPNELLFGQKTRTALDLSACDAPLTGEIAEMREAAREEAVAAIRIAQDRMAKYHDKKHKEPDFSSGYAFISLRTGYSLPGVKKAKLAAQRMGPFRIKRTVGRGAAFELQLPAHYKLHPIISVVHLEPAPKPEEDPYRRQAAPIQPVEMDSLQ